MRLAVVLALVLAPLALAGCAVQVPAPPAIAGYTWQHPSNVGQGVRWHDDVCVEC
jgi:hypothetical protein